MDWATGARALDKRNAIVKDVVDVFECELEDMSRNKKL